MKDEDLARLPMPKRDGILANEAGAETLGQYFLELAWVCWLEGEGFSGKRPFGDSGWESEIEEALVLGDAVEGVIDGDGFVESVDQMAVNEAIRKLFKYLRKQVKAK